MGTKRRESADSSRQVCRDTRLSVGSLTILIEQEGSWPRPVTPKDGGFRRLVRGQEYEDLGMERNLLEQWHGQLGIDFIWETIGWGKYAERLNLNPPHLCSIGLRGYPAGGRETTAYIG